MPDIYPHRVAIRAPAHSIRVHASVYVGAVVASGTVGVIPFSPLIVLGVTYLVGSYLDVRVGMEIIFYTSTGKFKGRTTVPDSSIPIVSNNLPIRELSLGTIDVEVGDLFEVQNEYRLHDRLVAASSGFPPSYLGYSDENSAQSPVTCSGGYYAAYVDGYYTLATPHVYATVRFAGSTSYVVDPDSSGAHSHLWTFPAGSTPGTSTSADPTGVQIPVGSWIVQHDFTDTDNGKTTTQYVIVMIHDDSFPPYELMLDNGIQTDEQYGWRATARLFQDATLDDIPDGAPILLWTDERINGSWQSFGNVTPGRENMLVVGYAHADNNTAEAAIKKVYFDIVSPLQRLDEIAGYSKVLEQSETPDSWAKYKGLTTKRAKIQLLYRYSTFIQSGFDLIFDSGYLDKDYPALYLQRSTPLQQVRELANGVDARITCDPTGRIDIYTHPAYILLADRAAVTVTFTLATQDVIDFSFSRLHDNQVELMKTSGFTDGYTGNNPIFSLYPGNAPGEATNAPTRDRLICDDQDDLNERTGRYGALSDNVFIDADGYWQRAFELKLTLFGSYNFFRLYHEYVKFDIDGSSNLRGIDLSGFRFWVKSVQVTYSGGTARVALVLQTETNAPAGTTFIPPQSTYFPTTTTPNNAPITVLPAPGVLSRTLANIALFNADGNIYYTLTGNYPGVTGGPTIAARQSLVSLGMSGTLNDFAVDAYSPGYTASGAVNGWIASDAEVRQITDIFGTPALNTATSFSPAPGAGTVVQVDFERGEPNWGFATFYSVGNGTYIVTTTDGVTFTQRLVTANYNTAGNGSPPGMYVNPHATGEGYVSAFVGATGAHVASGLYHVTGHGSSITHITNPNVQPGDSSLAVCLVVPYTNTGDTVFYSLSSFDTLTIKLMRVVGSGSPVDISPTYGGASYGPAWTNRALSISPTNPNVGVLCGWNKYDGSELGGVWRSENLMAAVPTWTLVVTPTSTGGVWRRAYVSGDDPNTCFLLGIGGHFGVINGYVLDDRSANILSAYPGAGEFVGICGKGA